eukprot:TRINITY_DN3942_c1_g1_i1.p1 TRINITY_DN3942_c1_g1~~TRINITY_DN3942_c1_g1_i1.p1  ORF type:complete len:745 (-),score=157.56 TRINITY_DN3942_c1_g1_i1:147-2183(-)
MSDSPCEKEFCPQVESSEALHNFPIADLPRDIVLSALSALDASALAASGCSSRLLLLLAKEVQRQPSLVVEVGKPSVVLQALQKSMIGTPTMGFVFGCGDFQWVSDILSKRLPLGCSVIGASTHELQALVPSASKDSQLQNVEGSMLDQDLKLALMLGSFPDAVATAFHVTSVQCQQISGGSEEEGVSKMNSWGKPTGRDWKTVVVLVCGESLHDSTNPERLLNVFQKSYPEAAILGGIAGSQLVLHSGGQTHIHEEGVVALALKGEVPLTALVSRGCTPLTAPLRTRGARIVSDDEEGSTDFKKDRSYTLMVTELIDEIGTSQQPLSAAISAQQKGRPRMPLFSGLRAADTDGGYLLDQLSQTSFVRGGGMQLPFDKNLASACGRETLAEALQNPPECQVRFFQLDPDACKADVTRLLGHVKQQCEEREEETLGAVMFTCGGRGRQFFQEEFVDAKAFKSSFPGKPLVGFWAGGEIGPQALADAAASEATRTGRAALQGFTAVFGVFRTPKIKPRLEMLSLSDGDVPVEVGKLIAKMAMDAKEIGNGAFRAGHHSESKRHYTRALEISMVPSAAVPASERSLLYSNRSMTSMKLADFDAAINDAEAAIALDSENWKAHHRRAQALLSLRRAEEAADGLKAALGSSSAPAAMWMELSKLLEQAEQIAARAPTGQRQRE